MKAALRIVGVLVIMLFASIGIRQCMMPDLTDLTYVEHLTGISPLSSGKLEYYFNGVSGFQNEGYIYYVISFEEKPLDLLNQIVNEKENIRLFDLGKNETFEHTVLNSIDIISHNEKFNQEYIVNFDHEYYYAEMHSSNSIYDLELNYLYIIYSKD